MSARSNPPPAPSITTPFLPCLTYRIQAVLGDDVHHGVCTEIPEQGTGVMCRTQDGRYAVSMAQWSPTVLACE